MERITDDVKGDGWPQGPARAHIMWPSITPAKRRAEGYRGALKEHAARGAHTVARGTFASGCIIRSKRGRSWFSGSAGAGVWVSNSEGGGVHDPDASSLQENFRYGPLTPAES
jgi:hypothetical protein